MTGAGTVRLLASGEEPAEVRGTAPEPGASLDANRAAEPDHQTATEVKRMREQRLGRVIDPPAGKPRKSRPP